MDQEESFEDLEDDSIDKKEAKKNEGEDKEPIGVSLF